MPDVEPLHSDATMDRSTRSDLKLGERIRNIRVDQALTLDELSRLSGVSKSALSKIENDRASPTFEVLERIARGLDVTLVTLFSEQSLGHIGRLTSTAAGEGRRTEDENYIHEFLCTGLKDRRMVPFVTTVKARDPHQFAKPASHQGEEFFYVLEGEVAFVSGSYAEIRLIKGDSLYFDSRLEHLCYTTDGADAKLLWVWCEST